MTLKHNEQCCKKFEQHSSNYNSLNFFRNFDDLTKLFLDLGGAITLSTLTIIAFFRDMEIL